MLISLVQSISSDVSEVTPDVLCRLPSLHPSLFERISGIPPGCPKSQPLFFIILIIIFIALLTVIILLTKKQKILRTVFIILSIPIALLIWNVIIRHLY